MLADLESVVRFSSTSKIISPVPLPEAAVNLTQLWFTVEDHDPEAATPMLCLDVEFDTSILFELTDKKGTSSFSHLKNINGTNTKIKQRINCLKFKLIIGGSEFLYRLFSSN